MTEINNSIPNFGHKIEKIINNNQNEEPKPAEQNEKTDKQIDYVPDTGVLGRSQVKQTRGADISKSVDEAVALAQENPSLLNGSDRIFNILYTDFINSGMEPSDAYMKALYGEQEFLEIGQNH